MAENIIKEGFKEVRTDTTPKESFVPWCVDTSQELSLKLSVFEAKREDWNARFIILICLSYFFTAPFLVPVCAAWGHPSEPVCWYGVGE